MTPPPRRPDDPTPPPAGDPDPLDDLPVAEVVPGQRRPDELQVADLVDAPPTPDLVLETAEPVPPPRAVPVADPRRDPPPWPAPPAEPEDATTRPRVFAACAVIGCLGLALLVAVGVVAFGVVMLLGHFGTRFGDRGRPAAPPAGDGWRRPGPVVPTAVAAPRTVALGGEVDAVGRAAGGRYLLLRIPSKQRLAVFDPVAGEVTHPVQLPTRGAPFAAGAAKLWVYNEPGRRVERWDLLTWQVEQTTAVPADLKRVDAMAVGAGSDGPVYLVTAGQTETNIWHLDGASLARTGFTRLGYLKARPGEPTRARASDDGRVLAVSAGGGVAVVAPGAADPTQTLGPGPSRPAVGYPTPDGQLVLTPRGPFATEGGWRRGDRDAYTFPPTQGGGLFLSLRPAADGRLSGPLRLHPTDSPGVLAADLPGVDVPRQLRASDNGDVLPADRLHLWPAAGLAATLPVTNNQLRLVPIDLPARLRSGNATDYLLFGSEPPTTAVRGQPWTYRPVVWTRQGTPRLEVLVPSGAAVAMAGDEVTWMSGPGDGPVEVTVRATAEDGNTAEQRFRVVVVDP